MEEGGVAGQTGVMTLPCPSACSPGTHTRQALLAPAAIPTRRTLLLTQAIFLLWHDLPTVASCIAGIVSFAALNGPPFAEGGVFVFVGCQAVG
mmetsp:Transcript_82332/g.137686  ORF Transcript_82332/g.137686 Transcript_82332/m.137686 type:complete len:93 (+) Transcript_82332:143-421(+)